MEELGKEEVLVDTEVVSKLEDGKEDDDVERKVLDWTGLLGVDNEEVVETWVDGTVDELKTGRTLSYQGES